MPSVLWSKVALVTGASRGIGKAIALALADAGAHVAVNYRERTRDAEATLRDIHRMGGKAAAFQADVSNSAAVTDLVRRVETMLGAIDILVNNAGIALRRNLDDLTEEDFDRTLATNLKSAFLCTQAVLPTMRARGWGRIINISSGAARGAGVVGVHYNASKAGMEGLTRGYAARVAMLAAEVGILPLVSPDGRAWEALSREELEALMGGQAAAVRAAKDAVAAAPADDAVRKAQAQVLATERPIFVSAAVEYVLRDFPMRETAFQGGWAPLLFQPSEWKLPEP